MKEIIYTSSSTNESNVPFSIQIAGISYCDGTYKIKRNNSDISCFEYIIEGTGTVISQNKTYHPSKDDIYFLHMGDDHLYYSDSKKPWIKIWINVTGPLVANIINSYNLRELNYIHNCNIRKELECIINLFKQNLKSTTNDELAILFHKLIQKIYLEAITEINKSPALKIKEYIDQNISRSIQIDELSKVIFRSNSQAIRIFKGEFGITPYNYFISRKIELAKSLLINTNLPIKDIAYRLSFADEHYFSSFFKSKSGISPKSYRYSTKR